MEDSRVRGGQTLGVIGAADSLISHGTLSRSTEVGEMDANVVHPAEPLHHVPTPVPEGRVHGGNIVAMLANGMNFGKQFNYEAEASTSTHN